MARKIKTQPTSYPKGAFYIARVCQAVASLIVAGEMFYFVYQLKHGGFRVPWMFFFLHAAALYTLITLVVTGLLHWRHRLSALFNGSLNVVACGLWVGGFGMLADAESETILDACTFTYWGNNTGVKICRLYKLLFAASDDRVSTMSAFVLDVVVYARVHPAAQYSRANPLLEKEDTTYAAGSYEDLYDPHRARSAPGITQPGPSAAQLPVYQPYCKSGKDSNAKGGIGA